jgi:hypothetical protein
VKPAFYMRTRAFSTALPKYPYAVNYSGLQFRVYPGPYQTILSTGNGRSRVVRLL